MPCAHANHTHTHTCTHRSSGVGATAANASLAQTADSDAPSVSKEDLLVFVGKTGPHVPSSSWAAHNTGETSGEVALMPLAVHNSPSRHGEVRSESASASPTRGCHRPRLLLFPRQQPLQLSTSHIEKYSKSFCEESKNPGYQKEKEHMAFFFRQQMET